MYSFGMPGGQCRQGKYCLTAFQNPEKHLCIRLPFRVWNDDRNVTDSFQGLETSTSSSLIADARQKLRPRVPRGRTQALKLGCP